MTKLNIRGLKRLAKKLKKENGRTHMQCLYIVAFALGYKSWGKLIEANK